jgi:hypothetical protein
MVEEKRTARWRLTEKAICEGVRSTTRYSNKIERRTPKRQAPDARGGRDSASVQKSRQLLACSLSPPYTPEVNIGCSTTPEAGALGSLLSAYSYTNSDADSLLFTNNETLYQPCTLVDQWEAEMGFAACDGLFAQLRYQGWEGVTMPY